MYFVEPEAYHHVNNRSLFDCLQTNVSSLHLQILFYSGHSYVIYQQQILQSVSLGFLTKFCMRFFPLHVTCFMYVILLLFDHW